MLCLRIAYRGNRALVATGESVHCQNKAIGWIIPMFRHFREAALLQGALTVSPVSVWHMDQVNRDRRLQSLLSIGLLSPSLEVMNS